MVILLRRIEQEDPRAGVHLFFMDESGDYIASVTGRAGDIRTRLSTPKNSYEFGHPFVARTDGDLALIPQKPGEWARTIQNEFERSGERGIQVQTGGAKRGLLTMYRKMLNERYGVPISRAKRMSPEEIDAFLRSRG